MPINIPARRNESQNNTRVNRLADELTPAANDLQMLPLELAPNPESEPNETISAYLHNKGLDPESKSIIAEMLDRGLQAFHEPTVSILRLYWLPGINGDPQPTFEQIARQLNLRPQYVKDLYSKAVERVKSVLMKAEQNKGSLGQK